MTTIVDARFAGGSIRVEPSVIASDMGPGVAALFPGYELILFSEEAVRLGVALIAAAHEAEREPVSDWP
ncbi:hypothetical protein [Subtercola endophyticus]|uniref:hypothetical protein n=1 Tax=Subtercola endophyticus TaxID=2895559 RepID=UPI001E57A33D|nr:hypothetical protein [Subtercola endophyticus]UFS58923.1 hypothetical protein LQ955_18330 [Subtercola endophyticus]